MRRPPARATSEPAAPPALAWLRLRWRSDRVFAAFLVLAFPPVFVTAAIAFVTWTAGR